MPDAPGRAVGLRDVLLALLLGCLTAAATVTVLRRGPDYQMTCAVDELACPEKLLAGGWPVAFLYDNPWISTRNALFFEDQFRLNAFAANAGLFAFFWLALIALFRGWQRQRRG